MQKRIPKMPKVELQDVPQLRETLRDWAVQRAMRAVDQFVFWRLSADGTLLSKTDDKLYYSEDAVHLPELGTRIFTGCDCADATDHLRRLHSRALELGIEAEEPVHCKHYYIRLLLQGHAIRVNGSIVRAKGS
ncbi:hypothetical protein [Armatimonas sp.]|uniref:hypothetical protein n=1 Tax=Armatimonas sp. TaxID=1872638 RepID=UPI0037513726